VVLHPPPLQVLHAAPEAFCYCWWLLGPLVLILRGCWTQRLQGWTTGRLLPPSWVVCIRLLCSAPAAPAA
jgi:hypothetical protein